VPWQLAAEHSSSYAGRLLSLLGWSTTLAFGRSLDTFMFHRKIRDKHVSTPTSVVGNGRLPDLTPCTLLWTTRRSPTCAACIALMTCASWALLPPQLSAAKRKPRSPELVVQTGHNVAVTMACFTLDDRTLISGDDDHVLKAWSITTGRELASFRKPQSSGPFSSAHVQHLATRVGRDSVAAIDADLFATTSTNRSEIQLWSPFQGTLRGSLKPPTPSIVIAATRYERLLAATDGQLTTIWNLSSSLGVQRFTSKNALVGLSFQYDGRSLLAVDVDARVHTFRLGVPGRYPVESVSDRLSTTHISRAVFSPSNRYLATYGDRDGSGGPVLEIIDLRSARTLVSLDVNTREFVFSFDDQFLAFGDLADVVLLDLRTLKRTPLFTSREGVVTALAFDHGTNMLAAANAEGNIRVFFLGTSRYIDFVSHNTIPTSVAVDNVSQRLAIGGVDSSLRLFDLTSGTLVGPSLQHEFPVSSVTFGSNGKWAASAAAGRETKFWDPSRWVAGTITAHVAETGLFQDQDSFLVTTTEVRTAISESGTLSAAAVTLAFHSGQRTAIELWQGQFQSKIGEVAELPGSVTQLTFSSSGRYLVAYAYGESAVLCDNVSRTRRLLPDGLTSAAFSADERYLAMGFATGTIVVRGLESPETVRTIARGSAPTVALVYDRAGQLFAGDQQGMITMWSGIDSQPLHFKASGSPLAMVTSKDGGLLIVSSTDGTTRIWDTSRREVIAQIVLFPNSDDWLIVTPEGLFDGTADSMRQVAWRLEDSTDTVPLDAFYESYFYPGLLAELFAGRRPKPPPENDLSIALRMPGLRTLRQQGLARIVYRGERVFLCVAAGASPASFLQLKVLNRGRSVAVEQRDFVIDSKDVLCSYRKELPIGEGPFELYSPNVAQHLPTLATHSHPLQSISKAGVLHIVTIGIDSYSGNSLYPSLKYAVADANAIEAAFASGREHLLNLFENVRIWPGLRDQGATLDGIRHLFNEIAAAIKPDDVLVLFLAGHGRVPPGRQMFYFIPYFPPPSEWMPFDETERALSTAMIAEGVRRISARRILLIVDACQSGGALDSLSKIAEVKAASDVRSQRSFGPEVSGGKADAIPIGVHIIAAASPIEDATEDAALGHGLLTAAILEGLDGAAANGSGRTVSVRALLEYVQNRVHRLASAAGRIQTAFPTSVGTDFIVFGH
jgi:WD40 repeat protein